MSPDEIKCAIEEKGYNFAVIAEALDIHPNNISRVVSRSQTSKKVALRICQVIGKPISEVFGDVPSYQKKINLRDPSVRQEKVNSLKSLFSQPPAQKLAS